MAGLVSVIIPVHNRPVMLERAVASVRVQTYANWEIVIVDDGSTDDTARVATELAACDARIRVLHQSNGGPGVAREAGRNVARGEFIQYLDSDDMLLPNKFTDQLAALARAPECDVAYGATCLVDAQGCILAAPLKGSGTDHSHLFPRLLRERWWSTHTPLYRRRLCDRVGAWPHQCRGEDWAYEARIGATGAVLTNCRTYVSHTVCHSDARLTGGALSREVLTDMAQLLITLDQCAREAGVPAEAPEWDHFRRWLFLEARRTAACGLREESDRLLGVLARHEDRALLLRVRLYKTLCRLVGARLAGQCYDALARGRRPERKSSASPGDRTAESPHA
jgi:glycosyltransferase involved in cell wall biosynthesis